MLQQTQRNVHTCVHVCTHVHDPIASSSNDEHQFSSSIFANGYRSTTQPHIDGVHLGEDVHDSSSVEFVSPTSYIDFVHNNLGTDHANRILSNNDGACVHMHTHMYTYTHACTCMYVHMCTCMHDVHMSCKQ
mmetsp:Transcript_41829/g.67297  ORF Transcript_41829/g.67297 Transcript_41829/m.67297 type:complete len:132 (+) Transcript_41829:276-671(+)